MNFPLGAIVNYYFNYHCAWSKVWQSSWLLYVLLLLVWFLYQNTLSVYTIKTEDGIPSYLFPLPIFMIFLSGSKFIGTVLFLLSSLVCSTGQVWINGGNVCMRIRSISTPLLCYFVTLLFSPLHQSGKDLSLLLKLSKVGALTTADGKSFQ